MPLTRRELTEYPFHGMKHSACQTNGILQSKRSLRWAVRTLICLTWLAALPALAIDAGMPNPPASPTVVTCGLMILDVVDINDVEETFEAELALVASWNDPRLAFDGDAEGMQRKIYQGDFQFAEVFTGWWPQLLLVNQIGPAESNAVKVEVYPDGLVRYLVQFNARLETPMQLHDYPFDSQELQASMIAFGNTDDEVVLEVDPRYADSTTDYVRREKDVNVAGWDLQGLDMKVEEALLRVGGGNNRFSRLVTTIRLQRRSWQLVWQMLFPLLVIVAMIWSIFWVDIDSLADRLNVSFVGVLTIVAYQFVVIENMPRMSYLTFTDTLLLVSFVTMALTIPQSLVIHGLVRSGNEERARAIDRVCRWAFPLTYVGLVAAIVAWHVSF